MSAKGLVEIERGAAHQSDRDRRGFVGRLSWFLDLDIPHPGNEHPIRELGLTFNNGGVENAPHSNAGTDQMRRNIRAAPRGQSNDETSIFIHQRDKESFQRRLAKGFALHGSDNSGYFYASRLKLRLLKLCNGRIARRGQQTLARLDDAERLLPASSNIGECPTKSRNPLDLRPDADL
jgi:hypothetical protein